MPTVRDGNPQTATTQNGRTESNSIAELVAGIINDAQTLIKQQFAMLRAEVKQDVNRATQASKFLGLGAACTALGGVFLAVGVVFLLNWLVPELALWACWMIVGGTILVIGVIAFFVGRTYLKTVTPLPDQTINAFQENLSWIANHQS